MFNLEQAIEDWRQKMLATGIETPVPLEELELHLREEMERQMRSGLSEEKAFEMAAKRVGEAQILEAEFKKIPAKPQKKLFQIFCAMSVGLVGWLICLHALVQLIDTDFSFATIGGSFSLENLLVGPLANLIMGLGSFVFGAWLIWRAGRSLKSMTFIAKIVLGASVIAFGLILMTFLVPNLAKIAHLANPSRAILLFGVIVAVTFLGVLLTALINCFKPSKDRSPTSPVN